MEGEISLNNLLLELFSFFYYVQYDLDHSLDMCFC